ncbi:MAG: hypothetical protein VX869_03590 [Chloroflexota bacterium]|nr:hypothetical protein [Chloroflexota bacterium]
MNVQENVQFLINSLDQIPPCGGCGMWWSTGDYECPHCGEDLDENLTAWAESVLKHLPTQT